VGPLDLSPRIECKMFRFLKRIFGGARAEKERIDGLLRQLKQMRGDLGQDLPLADLRPVLIPSSILEGGDWFGPHHYFSKLPVSLTWAYMRSENTMQYLSRDHASKLTADGIDWRSVARSALYEDSKKRPWMSRRNPNDESVGVAAVLQDDLGATRLLCFDQLCSIFPNGFRFFVPERYTAFVLADDSPADIEAQLVGMVQQTRRNADVPMSLEPFSHVLLREVLVEAGELS